MAQSFYQKKEDKAWFMTDWLTSFAFVDRACFLSFIDIVPPISSTFTKKRKPLKLFSSHIPQMDY